MRPLRCIAFLLLCAIMLIGASSGAPAPDEHAGTLSVQLESILNCLPGSEESELGDLCADAATAAAETKLALIPAAVLQNDLPAGPLTWHDITNAVAEEPLVVSTLTPAQLFSLLEDTLSHIVIDAENEQLLLAESQYDGFLQIAGFSLTIDASSPEGSRAYRVILSDGTEVYRTDNETALSVVTTQSVTDSTYDYAFPGEAVPLDLTLAEALSGYLISHEIAAVNTGRILHIGTRDSALIHKLPSWALFAVLAILIVCCIFFHGKERASKPFRPMQEGETKRKF